MAAVAEGSGAVAVPSASNGATGGFFTFELEKYFAIHEFSAKYLLSCADAQSMSMKDLLALANEKELALWENLWLGYTESRGLPALLDQIRESYYPLLSKENLLCFAGELP
jgi:hypothetical protein